MRHTRESLGSLAALHAAAPCSLRRAGRPLAVFSWNGQLYVLDDRCPHQGAPLSAGGVSSDGYVECPAHCWEYRLSDGQARDARHGAACSFLVEEEAGEAFVQLPPAAPGWDDPESNDFDEDDVDADWAPRSSAEDPAEE
jgi:nitrite reductase/ring-hydroxylating ferredoxin subunit